VFLILARRRPKASPRRQPAHRDMQIHNFHGKWFAVHVKPRAEWSVAEALRSKGYEHFLPHYVCRPDFRRRSRHGRFPLFPGYVFCRYDSPAIGMIVTTPGVLRVVGYGNAPIPVDENEIAALRTIMDSGLGARPWPRLEPGDYVRIDDGPLRGLTGVLCRVNKRRQLIVSLTLLQRAALVELEPEWVTSAFN
jgi:transcription antitermination factor NusG